VKGCKCHATEWKIDALLEPKRELAIKQADPSCSELRAKLRFAIAKMPNQEMLVLDYPAIHLAIFYVLLTDQPESGAHVNFGLSTAFKWPRNMALLVHRRWSTEKNGKIELTEI